MYLNHINLLFMSSFAELVQFENSVSTCSPLTSHNHCIVPLKGSRAVYLSVPAYELFMTVRANLPVITWSSRTHQCVSIASGAPPEPTTTITLATSYNVCVGLFKRSSTE